MGVAGLTVAIDVGGTFTDLVALTGDGSILLHKEFNTGGDRQAAVLRGMAALIADLGLAWSDVGLVVHGTTIATNAVLTGQGAPVALLATQGLTDALALRRGRRAHLWNNHTVQPPALVPRWRRFGVAERVLADGTLLQPVAPAAVAQMLAAAAADGVTAVAVCFMHSYLNPANELETRRLVQQFCTDRKLDWHVSVSAELAPEMGYYERTSTTVLDAYVGPVVRPYLERLWAGLQAQGFRGTLNIMQASGGSAPVAAAAARPILTLNSGPAGGAACGAYLATLLGYDEAVTFDMGGTSCDVALIKDGAPLVAESSAIAGYHLQLPVLDVVSIGAGGGSIVHADRAGLLRVGPESAGADPGPACYGKGGARPTVTDVNLHLGLLSPEWFFGGQLRLDQAAATAALTAVAAQIGSDPLQVAHAAYQLVNAAMASAVREVSIFRGHDPRRMPLVVGGGAGALHACEVARMLEMPLVVVPPVSSNFSAMGLLVSDVRYDAVRALRPLPLEHMDPEQAVRVYAEMQSEGQESLSRAGFRPEQQSFSPLIDLRYRGQFQTITVPYPTATVGAATEQELQARFHAAHTRLFRFAATGDPIEVVAQRLVSRGRLPVPEWRGRLQVTRSARPPGRGQAQVALYPGGPVPSVPATELRGVQAGPLLATDPFWTAWIPADYCGGRDRFGNLLAVPAADRPWLQQRVG